MSLLDSSKMEEIQPNLRAEEADKPARQIILPGLGKLVSDFAYQISDCLKDKNHIFYRLDSKEIVEIGRIKAEEDSEEINSGFMTVTPNRFITLAEKYMIPVIKTYNKETHQTFLKEKSMGAQLANTLLSSDILQSNLPQINRIFTIPMPIMYEGNLTFPKRGYDKRFKSWLAYNAPELSNPKMSLEEAKQVIDNCLKEFCFQTKQDKTNAIAALITPYLRGLFSSFSIRTPVFFYIANRERAGKDYLAGITGIIYEGQALEESPVSSDENSKGNNTDEFRKKFLANLIIGRKRMHFSNNKGYINNAAFEAIITAQIWSDRVLGKSESLTFANEMDFSMSGNTGIGYTADMANRCRFIRLFLDIEDANSRNFENPDLHKWIEKNRGKILSALYSLVQNWINNGKKGGSVSFASFHEWAQICGGIMESASYDNPCVPDKEVNSFGGDSETEDMKQLFEICFEKSPNFWLTKKEIKEMIQGNDLGIMSDIDFNDRSAQTKFALMLHKFIGRVLSDIRFIVKDPKVRPARQLYKFIKEENITNKTSKGGNVVTICNVQPQENLQNIEKSLGGKLLPELPWLPNNGQNQEKLDKNEN